MKTTFKTLIILIMVMVVFSLSQTTFADARRPSATLILHNGKIFTGTPGCKWAEAVVIRNRFITYVGDSDQALQKANANTQIIDLQGKLVIPGFNDSHVHILPFNVNGPMLFGIDAMMGDGPTLDQFLDALQQATYIYPAGTWIYVAVGGTVFDDPQVDRYFLDNIAPNHPVVLLYMHSMIINTQVLQEAGISETEPDCFGGVYDRYAGTDILNGRIHEYAEYNLVRYITMNTPVDQLRQFYSRYMDAAVSLGVTTVQDLPIGLTIERAEQVLEGIDLKMRIRVINCPMTTEEVVGWHPGSHTRPHRSLLSASGVKWFHDGTVIERNGAVTIPYLDRPGWYGLFNFPLGIYQQIVADGLKSPADFQQRLYHTFGDRAVDYLLDAMSSTGSDKKWKKHRVQLIHGDLIRPDQIPLIQDKGLVVVQNPTHLAVPHLMIARYGPDRVAEIQPLQSLLDAGIPLAFGTDGIGDIISPFVDIMMAVIHPTRPAEALTVEEALIAYTSGSAYAEFKEDIKGKIKKGMLADLAVLSQDIFTIAPDQIAATFSLLTIVDGKIVFDSGVLQ